MSTNFTPPPVTSYQGQDPQFTPPPLTSYEGQEEGPSGMTAEGLPLYTATVTRNYLGESIPTPQQKRGFFGTLADYFRGIYQTGEDMFKHGIPAWQGMKYAGLYLKREHGEPLTADEQAELDWLERHDPLRPQSYMNPAMEHPDVAPAATAVAHAIQGDPGAAAADIVFGYTPRGIQAARYAPEIARAIPENISLPAARQTGKIVGGITGATVGRGFGIPGLGGGAVVGAKLGEAGAEMFWRKLGGEAILERQGALNDLSGNLYGRQFEKLPQARQTEIRGMYDAMGADAAIERVNALNASADTLYGRKYAGLNPAQQADLAGMYESRGPDGAAQYVSDLNDFAEGLGGKYKNLSPDQQAATRALFNRAQTQTAAARPAGPPTAPSTTTPAAAPTASGMTLTEMIDEELAAKRAAQTQRLVGIERTPAWQRQAAPVETASPAPAPLSDIALPSGRVPGGYQGEPVPAAAQPPRAPAWQSLGDTVRLGAVEEGPLPQIVRPTRPAQPPRPTPTEAPATPTVEPATGASLNDLIEAMRGIASRRKAPGEAPLSGVGKPPEPAPEPTPTPAPASPQPPAEFQTPALEGLTATEPGAAVNVYKQRAQVIKAQRFANTLEAEGLPFAKTKEWTPDDWKAHAEKVGENAPSQDTVNQILAEQQIRESKQAFESARAEGLSKTERFLAAMNERNITHAESLKWGPGEWNQLAAELGENKPQLKEIQNIRAKLKYQESQAGK